jgi:drug/metabolite transporter (DMT)-like permease
MGAWVTAGESLDGWQLLGVILVSLGIASLTFGRGWPRGDHGRAILFAGFTCLTIAAYSLIDGFGVRRAGASLGYIVWLFVIDAIPFPFIVALHRRASLASYIRSAWATGIGGGFMSALAYGIVIWAMGHTAMAGVVSLRETSVIFAAAMGALFMGESFGRWRIGAAIAVTIGNVLIHL